MTDEYTIQPEKYEVVRLITGAEFVCMTIDKEDRLLAILPMICHLFENGDNTTRVSFQPYTALSDDINIVVKKEHILHRNDLHPQYIEIYDQASVKWMEMIEESSIPISNTISEQSDEVLSDASFSERLDEYLEEMLDEKPDDPKKLH